MAAVQRALPCSRPWAFGPQEPRRETGSCSGTKQQLISQEDHLQHIKDERQYQTSLQDNSRHERWSKVTHFYTFVPAICCVFIFYGLSFFLTLMPTIAQTPQTQLSHLKLTNQGSDPILSYSDRLRTVFWMDLRAKPWL